MSLSKLQDLVMGREAWPAEAEPMLSLGRKEADMTERLNWTELNWRVIRGRDNEICLSESNIIAPWSRGDIYNCAPQLMEPVV